MPTPRTPSAEELIEAGPTTDHRPAEELYPDRAIDSADQGEADNKPIDFTKFKERAELGDNAELPELPEKTKKLLEEEEKKAKENEEKEGEEKENEDLDTGSKGKDTTDSKETKKSSDSKLDKDTTGKPETKEKSEQKEDDDSLIHLELGISPKSVRHLRNMDRPAREWLTSELKTRLSKITTLTNELKEAKEKVGTAQRSGDGNNLPEAWYENDQAVVLLPEFTETAGRLNTAKGYIQHYYNQLIEAKEGRDWTDFDVGADGKVVEVRYKGGSAAETHIQKILNDLNDGKNKLEGQLNTIQTNFKQNHVRSREHVVKLEDQYFPQYKDAEVLAKNKDFIDIDKALNKFGLNKDRMSNITKKMYVYTMEALARNEELEKEVEELRKKVGVTGDGRGKGKNKNGPTGDEINHGQGGKGGSGDPGDEPVNFKAFERFNQE